MHMRADAATPVPILALQDLQQLQQLQQQSLSLQQFVLVHPTTSLQPAQLVISQPPQGQQGEPRLLPCAVRQDGLSIACYLPLNSVFV